MAGMLCTSCERRFQIYPYKRVLQVGDDVAWAQPGYDDSGWNKLGSTTHQGVFWVRFELVFTDYIDSIDVKGLQQISLGSYEAYWDGIFIGGNGMVGERLEEEVPGSFISTLPLPDSLCTRGKHVLALRVSRWQDEQMAYSWNTFYVEDYNSSNEANMRLTAIMYMLGGGYLLSAVYYLLLFATGGRQIGRLVFGLCCLSFFTLIVLEYFKFFYHYPYYAHAYRLTAIGLVNLSIAFLVPLFLSIHFRIPFRRFFLSIYATFLILYAVFVGYAGDTDGQRISLLMLILSIVITLVALVKKRKGSIVMIVAFTIIAGLNYFPNYGFNQLLFDYDINLFLSFTVLVLAMLYLMVQRNREIQVAYEASLLRSARLQNELLRKNIQPHFIMNTLTAIMEWVEISPKKSIEFIEALAGEFEALNDIADLTLVPVAKEITLCKRHLETMSFRKETDFVWRDHGIDPEAMVPPAVLLTLVENGITHNAPDKEGKLFFDLEYRQEVESQCYILKVTGANRTVNPEEGTGLKYVRSRLDESFGDAWSMESGPVDDGWETKIYLDARF